MQNNYFIMKYTWEECIFTQETKDSSFSLLIGHPFTIKNARSYLSYRQYTIYCSPGNCCRWCIDNLFDSSSWKYFIFNSFAESCIFPYKFNKMDKINENGHTKQPVKLENIDVTPILAALLIGFIVIGKWPRHVDGQQQVGSNVCSQNTF